YSSDTTGSRHHCRFHPHQFLSHSRDASIARGRSWRNRSLCKSGLECERLERRETTRNQAIRIQVQPLWASLAPWELHRDGHYLMAIPRGSVPAACIVSTTLFVAVSITDRLPVMKLLV